MRVAFLFGSGISADGGMPSMGTISAQVFTGDGVIRHTDATYYLADAGAPNHDLYRVAALPAIAFAQHLCAVLSPSWVAAARERESRDGVPLGRTAPFAATPTSASPAVRWSPSLRAAARSATGDGRLAGER